METSACGRRWRPGPERVSSGQAGGVEEFQGVVVCKERRRATEQQRKRDRQAGTVRASKVSRSARHRCRHGGMAVLLRRRSWLRLPRVGGRLLLLRRCLRVCQRRQGPQIFLQLLLIPAHAHDGSREHAGQASRATAGPRACCCIAWPARSGQRRRRAHSMHWSSFPRFWFSTMAAISLAFSSSICGDEEGRRKAAAGGQQSVAAAAVAPQQQRALAAVGGRACWISTVVSKRGGGCCCC